MTVEAVPLVDARGHPIAESDIKTMHTTMQTLGRFAMITGMIAVAAFNIAMFAGVETMSEAEKASIYADIYLLALIIPVVSVAGVTLGSLTQHWRARRLRAMGIEEEKSRRLSLPRRRRSSPTG